MARLRATLLATIGLAAALLLGGCVPPTLLPVAAFTFVPAAGGVSPLTVTFDASGSHAPQGAIAEYLWDFGDGSAGKGMTIAHSYVTDSARIFTVTLTVIDHLGQQNSVRATIHVQAPADEDVTVSIAFVWPFHYDASGEDAANLNDEYFTLQNTGEQAVDLSHWTVENERGVRFRFPNGVVLQPNAVLTVHSGSGSNTPSIFYWNALGPVWNNDYDLAVLRDSAGTIIDYYSYNAC